MKKRTFNLHLVWFVVKYTLSMSVASLLSWQLMERWGSLRMGHSMMIRSVLLMTIFSSILLLYAFIYSDLNKGFISLTRILFAHAFVGLFVLARSRFAEILMWLIAYLFFMGMLWFIKILVARFLEDRPGPFVMWVLELIVRIKASVRHRSVFCFACALFFWIPFPLVFLKIPPIISYVPIGLSYLFLTLGVGFELFDLLAQREHEEP